MSIEFTNRGKSFCVGWNTADEICFLMAELGVPDPGNDPWAADSWAPLGHKLLKEALEAGRVRQVSTSVDSLGRELSPISWTRIVLAEPDDLASDLLDAENKKFVEQLLEFLAPAP